MGDHNQNDREGRREFVCLLCTSDEPYVGDAGMVSAHIDSEHKLMEQT